MILSGEGLSTDALFAQGFAQMRQLKNRCTSRRGRDKAGTLLTDLFLTIDELARHVGAISFSEGPVCVDEDEEEMPEERVSMAEALNVSADEDVEDLPAARNVEELLRQNAGLRKGRLEYFQSFLDYLVKGCRHERDVTKKVLAITRRVRPQILNDFGLSQADVARKLGEQRATVSAREKRTVEATLKEAGARGLLSNGARGASTSAACAKAAKGNRNRSGGRRRGGPKTERFQEIQSQQLDKKSA